MKTQWNKIWNNFKNPPAWGKAVSFLITFVSATAALCMLWVDYQGNALAFVAYSLFGIAGASLSYSVYLIVIITPNARKNIVNLLEKHEFTNKLLRNYGFRTVIFTIGSFWASVIFSLFNGYMGIVNRSIWYGALATYYIALTFLRGGILTYHKHKKGKSTTTDFSREEYTKAKVYKNSGIILLVLNVALSSAIAQMIFSDAHFTYIGWTIFAFAAYAFYKITMSIINLVRARKQADLTLKAIINVNLADATVSILALQTALLSTFSDGSLNISLMNTATGIAVSAFCIGLGVFMITVATKKIKHLQKENNDDERQSI